jgi:L-threonylcarbamoyladenylate synthase
MEIVKIKKNDFKKALNKAKEALLSGNLVIVPTETVYGIVALARLENAVKKIYKIKERPAIKPLPLIALNLSSYNNWAVFNKEAVILAKKFWPGPLTLIVPKGEKTSNLISAGKDSVAVRIPGHYFVLALLKEINEPLVATSANISGGDEPVNLDDVPESIKEKTSIGVDSGKAVYEIPSTIIDLTKEQKPILRPGPVTGLEIKKALEEGGRK